MEPEELLQKLNGAGLQPIDNESFFKAQEQETVLTTTISAESGTPEEPMMCKKLADIVMPENNITFQPSHIEIEPSAARPQAPDSTFKMELK